MTTPAEDELWLVRVIRVTGHELSPECDKHYGLHFQLGEDAFIAHSAPEEEKCTFQTWDLDPSVDIESMAMVEQSCRFTTTQDRDSIERVIYTYPEPDRRGCMRGPATRPVYCCKWWVGAALVALAEANMIPMQAAQEMHSYFLYISS